MAPVDACPRCGSALLQPLRCEPLPDDEFDVGLRCPDCETCFRVVQTAEEARRLDRRQIAARAAVTRAHDEVVRESMAALAAAFGAAFERDLLGADDFAPRR
ncbi:MAG TPA: hypothetical protein VF533_21665 [Solirubrobacteraceae bacterium]